MRRVEKRMAQDQLKMVRNLLRAGEKEHAHKVASRTCAGCATCCVTMEIHGIDKKPWTPCPNLARVPVPGGIGCGVYPDRPHECVVFLCAWRQGMTDVDPRIGLSIDLQRGVGDVPGVVFCFRWNPRVPIGPEHIPVIERAAMECFERGRGHPIFLIPPGAVHATVVRGGGWRETRDWIPEWVAAQQRAQEGR